LGGDEIIEELGVGVKNEPDVGDSDFPPLGAEYKGINDTLGVGVK